MKIQIELEDEVSDLLVKESLSWHTKNAQYEIKKFRSRENVQPHHIENYDYNVRLLAALKIVNEYFGVKS